jgi:excisionase family DNA binding protein
MLRIPARSKRHNGEGDTACAQPATSCPVNPEPAHTPVTQPGLTPPFLSLREAADWLCVSMSTVKRMIAQGQLSTIRVGHRQKIPADVLAAYVGKDLTIPTQAADINKQS